MQYTTPPGCKLEFNVNFDNILLKNKIKELQRQTKLQFKAIITKSHLVRVAILFPTFYCCCQVYLKT